MRSVTAYLTEGRYKEGFEVDFLQNMTENETELDAVVY